MDAIRELVFIVWVWCGIIQTIMRKKEADGMGMFDFRSRAERERDYQAFFKRVFPEGEPQRQRVERTLRERLPGEDIP